MKVINYMPHVRKVISANLFIILGFPGVFGLSAFAVQSDEQIATQRQAQGVYCFGDSDREALYRNRMKRHFSSYNRLGGLLIDAGFEVPQLEDADIELLSDDRHGRICKAFNEMYVDLIAKRQVEAAKTEGHFFGWDEVLDPEAFAYDPTYLRVGQFYIAKFGTARKQLASSEQLVSTGGYSIYYVHDKDLNLLGSMRIR